MAHELLCGLGILDVVQLFVPLGQLLPPNVHSEQT